MNFVHLGLNFIVITVLGIVLAAAVGSVFGSNDLFGIIGWDVIGTAAVGAALYTTQRTNGHLLDRWLYRES